MNLKRATYRVGWLVFGTGYVVLAGAAIACAWAACDLCQRASDALDEWSKG